MKLIVGLGNPGTEHEQTRHNVGFRVVRAFHTLHAEEFGGWKTRTNAEIAEGRIGGEKCVLVLPQTFMNRSGEAVRPLADFWDVPMQDVIVVYDDLDLPIGSLRLRTEGGSGGHNGVKSVIAGLGGEAFPRVRLGIAGPSKGTISTEAYVLQRFSADEGVTIQESIEKATEALNVMLEDGMDAAMNRYNGDQEKADQE